MSANRNAPASNRGASTIQIHPESTAAPRTAVLLDAIAGYAVLVNSGDGRYRRRVFLTLAAAERAVERAQDRDQTAHLVLCRLIPTGVIA